MESGTYVHISVITRITPLQTRTGLAQRFRLRVKLSARKVLELLAGRISREEFFQHEEVLALENPFDQALRGDKLIASLERSDEDDDDWLIFEMTGPDPAIAPFRLPQRESKK